MSKTKTSRRKTSVFYATAITLLLWLPFVVSLHYTNEKYLEYQQNYESKHFSDVTSMGKQHLLDCIEKKTESVNNAGLTLSIIGINFTSIDNYFPQLYKSSSAYSGLVFSGDGTLIYGDTNNGSLFLETAQEAQSTGQSTVSDILQCNDGEKRVGIASPFSASDGSTAAVVLIFSQSAIALTPENQNLSDGGKLCIIDSNGSLIFSQVAEEQLLSGGQLAVEKPNDLMGQSGIFSITKDGKEYLAYLKPVGINDWLVLYAVQKEKLNIIAYVGLTWTRIIGFSALFLLFLLVAFSFYKADLGAQRMELYKKKFRIATSQSARAAFEYDRRTDKLTLISESEHVILPKPFISLSELRDLVHPSDCAAYMQSVSELREQGTTSTTVRVFNFCGKEVYRWYHVTATFLADSGEGKSLTIGSVEDIDERENEHLLLYEKATTDSLTGLWNRFEIEKVVTERLSKLEPNEHSVFAIIDLDNFKDINDDFGHDCGDKALIFFADKLRYTFRFGDVLGRLGGDEFVVFMTLTAEREIVERRLKELMANMLSRSDDESNMPPITCSIGCCIASHNDTFESVYKLADQALYKSKTRGKQHFTIVD